MLNSSDYNYPLAQPGGFFKGVNVPSFANYDQNFQIHFLRYLYYMCCMNAEGEYPVKETISIDQIERDFNQKKVIRKILVGEAPPALTNSSEYFYNPNSRWPSRSPWINAPQKCLFNTQVFPTKIDFLISCARSGFLLLDLFPYAISYSKKRNGSKYKQACIDAFSGYYHFNIIHTLNQLKSCLNNNLAIGFGLISFGNIILNNKNSVNAFSTWAINNGISLTPSGSIDLLRNMSVTGASNYLRVVGKRGLFGPDTTLMSTAGF